MYLDRKFRRFLASRGHIRLLLLTGQLPVFSHPSWLLCKTSCACPGKGHGHIVSDAYENRSRAWIADSESITLCVNERLLHLSVCCCTMLFVYVAGIAIANQYARPIKNRFPLPLTWPPLLHEYHPFIWFIHVIFYQISHDPPINSCYDDTQVCSENKKRRVQYQQERFLGVPMRKQNLGNRTQLMKEFVIHTDILFKVLHNRKQLLVFLERFRRRLFV